MGGFVQKQRLAAGDAVDVDRMRVEIVGEGLLDVADVLENPRLVGRQMVADVVDVGRIGDGAVEIGAQPVDLAGQRDAADADQPGVVPGGVGAAQLHLEARQAILLDPVDQGHRLSVVGLAARPRSAPSKGSSPPTRCQAARRRGGSATKNSAG